VQINEIDRKTKTRRYDGHEEATDAKLG
jgi:hypothetical protein